MSTFRLPLVTVLAFLALVVCPTIHSQTPLSFVPVTPCRVADTRNNNGTFGGPSIPGGTSRDFPIPQSGCGVPSSAAAYSLNFTVVPHSTLGYLTVWPTGLNQPVVSTLNSFDGRVKANAAIVPAGSNGAISAFMTDTTDLIIDLNGYFVSDSSQLAFYPLSPCRVLDTRNATGPLGGPTMAVSESRDFPIQSSGCGIPAAAQAYSLNFTAVPQDTLGYLTVWPTGKPRPVVSTLNSPTGAITANAAILPAGAGGQISAYVTDTIDLVADINGYFAPFAPGGQALYSAVPCRVLDTRNGSGAFSGVLPVNVVGAPCAIPAYAQAFVFNATVVPQTTLGYLTLWPDGTIRPVVSTLNASDGAITSNMAIVPTTDGSIDAFTTDKTDLILDVFSYFGPDQGMGGPPTAPTYFLAGNWAGTATVVDGNVTTTYNVGASIGQTATSLTATLTVLSTGNIPVTYTVTGQISGNTVSFVTASSDSVGVDINASGMISPDGLQVSGSSLDGSTGTMTWDGLHMLSGLVKILDDTTWTSTATTDGQHLTGGATSPLGDSVTWSLTRQ